MNLTGKVIGDEFRLDTISVNPSAERAYSIMDFVTLCVSFFPRG